MSLSEDEIIEKYAKNCKALPSKYFTSIRI